MLDSPMHASHSVVLTADVPHDYHSNCPSCVTTPHMAIEHLMGIYCQVGFCGVLAGPMKSAWLNTSMQSIWLHFGASVKTAACTTEAAKEVQCLLNYSSKIAAELTALLPYCSCHIKYTPIAILP